MPLFPPSVLAAAAALAITALAAPSVFAQSDADRATARSLGVDGQQALDRKDYKTAEDHFRRADSLVHAPTLMLGLARSLTGLGRFVEAQETYNRIVREGVPATAPDAFKRALTDAKKEVETVEPKIAGVTISVQASGGSDVSSAKVMLDGAAVSTASLGVKRSIDPGPHTLQVSADGYKAIEARFDVPAGGSVDEPVSLEVDRTATAPGPAEAATGATAAAVERGAAPASTKGHSILPWVAFGVGAAGLGLGAITGFMAMSQHSTLANECHGSVCGEENSGDLSSYHTVAALSTVGFVVGGVGIAGGVILLLTQPKGESSAPAPAASPSPPSPPQTGLRVVPVVGPGSIGVVGSF